MTARKTKAKLGLKGKFFHTYKKDTGRIHYQGRVLSEDDDGFILVQLFDWLVGAPSDQLVFRKSDTTEWTFYECADDMVETFKHHDRPFQLADRAKWDAEREAIRTKRARAKAEDEFEFG